MKTFIGLSLCLVGTSAFACPNLTGDYHCSPSENHIVITQSEAAGITTYVISGKPYAANGKLDSRIENQADGSTYYVTFKYTCDGTTLTTSENYDHEGKDDMPLEVWARNSKYEKSGDSLTIKTVNTYGDGSYSDPTELCR